MSYNDRERRRGAPLSFHTARLSAVAMAELHLPLLRIMHQNEAMMARIGGTRDEAATRSYLATHMTHWQEHDFGFWMLFDRLSGEPAGLAGLRWFDHGGERHVELGYGLLPQWWDKGLGSEIAAACIDQARAMGIDRLVAITTTDHRASQHVLHKLGFHDAGTIMLHGAERAWFIRDDESDGSRP